MARSTIRTCIESCSDGVQLRFMHFRWYVRSTVGGRPAAQLDRGAPEPDRNVGDQLQRLGGVQCGGGQRSARTRRCRRGGRGGGGEGGGNTATAESRPDCGQGRGRDAPGHVWVRGLPLALGQVLPLAPRHRGAAERA